MITKTLTAELLPATVRDELQKRINEITSEVGNLLKTATSQQTSQAIERAGELNALLESARQVRENAEKSKRQEVVDALRQFESEIRMWRTIALSLSGNEAFNNARARFSDAGGWAVHFSIVRMTVSTFFITAAWGLVSVKWDEYSRPLALAALCIWGLAGFFLFIFTRATYDRSTKQKEWQAELAASRQDKPHSPERALSAKTWRQIWMPFWAYLVVSILYLCLLDAWAQHGGDPYVTWPALFKPEAVSVKQRPMDQLVHCIDEMNGSLKNLATSLSAIDAGVRAAADIGLSRTIVTPTPTSTPTPTVTPAARTEGEAAKSRGSRGTKKRVKSRSNRPSQ